jgi:hypothetical protein
MRYDVIAPPTDAEGGLFSEINDNSVAILLTYGTARILLAGDAEANEEEYMANGTYTDPLTIVRFETTKQPAPRFRALLNKGDTRQRLEFVAIPGKPPLAPKGTPSVLP